MVMSKVCITIIQPIQNHDQFIVLALYDFKATAKLNFLHDMYFTFKANIISQVPYKSLNSYFVTFIERIFKNSI